MKLNLLPTYVSKEGAAKTGIVIGVVLALVGILLAALMGATSAKARDTAKSEARDQEVEADRVVKRAAQANDVIAQAGGIIRNSKLATAMDEHNSVYPDLYNAVLPFVPDFFRVTSLQAQAIDATSCQVTIQGVLSSYQQYADLMLALLRIKGAQSVSRTGYTLDNAYVPAITPEDQVGRPHKDSEPTIPDDPLRQYDRALSMGRQTGYLGVNNFGTAANDRKGAMPGQSEITVTVIIAGVDLQTPIPNATLAAAGGGAAGATAPAGFNTPAGPTGPGGPSGAPGAPAKGK